MRMEFCKGRSVTKALRLPGRWTFFLLSPRTIRNLIKRVSAHDQQDHEQDFDPCRRCGESRGYHLFGRSPRPMLLADAAMVLASRAFGKFVQARAKSLEVL